MRKRDRNVAVGTLIAAGIGYVAGILSAPKSGRETRKDVQATAVKLQKQAEKNLKKLHSELSDLIDKGTKQATTVSTKTKKEYNQVLKKAGVAKEKARNILSAIHEGDTDENDLHAAIEEVTSAVDHLKKYISSNVSPKKKS